MSPYRRRIAARPRHPRTGRSTSRVPRAAPPCHRCRRRTPVRRPPCARRHAAVVPQQARVPVRRRAGQPNRFWKVVRAQSATPILAAGCSPEVGMPRSSAPLSRLRSTEPPRLIRQYSTRPADSLKRISTSVARTRASLALNRTAPGMVTLEYSRSNQISSVSIRTVWEGVDPVAQLLRERSPFLLGQAIHLDDDVADQATPLDIQPRPAAAIGLDQAFPRSGAKCRFPHRSAGAPRGT